VTHVPEIGGRAGPPGAVLVFVALLMTSACGTGDGASRAQLRACGTNPPERIQPIPLNVRNLMPVGPATTVDSDGDGRPDEITSDSPGVIVIRRGDGALRFAHDGHGVMLQTWGDVDGDGRDDLVVTDDVTPSGPDATFLVSGATAAGTHEPPTVGVRIDRDAVQPWPADLDGRPGVDLVVPDDAPGAPHTDVYSGADMLRRGPGGDARGTPPVRRLDGLVRGPVVLREGGEPETLLLSRGHPYRLRFVSRPGVVLEAPLGPVHRVDDILVFDEGGVRKIALQVDRQVAIWPVPPPCGG
jgi:hypothetical protein